MHFRRISSCKFAVVYISIVFNDTIFHADFFFCVVFLLHPLVLCDVGSSRISLCSVHLMCYVNSFCAYCNRDSAEDGVAHKRRKKILYHFSALNWIADSKGNRKKEATKLNWLTLRLHGAWNRLTMLIFPSDSWLMNLLYRLNSAENFEFEFVIIQQTAFFWVREKVISINYSNEFIYKVSRNVFRKTWIFFHNCIVWK